VGAFAASIFHLVTHAFFKACLFLGAGSVIARCGHTNDMRWYGGLRKWMPVTAATFWTATLAIAGCPLLSGFMSKDEILAQARFSTRGAWGLWALGTVGALLTSFYMFRAAYMTFGGANRTPGEVKTQLKESPRVMTWVLVVLAAGALLVGWLGVPEGLTKLARRGDWNWFAHQLKPVVMARGVVAAPEPEMAGAATAPASVLREGVKREATGGEEAGLLALAVAVFGAGWIVARWSYGGDGARAAALAPRLAYVRRLLHRKWFVDELYDQLIVRPFYGLCSAFDSVDRRVVDGAVNLSAALTELTGQAVKLLQSGVARHYAAWLLGGAVLVLWLVMG
jgi:NADH-quinone oxidoreductase subunit L